MGSKKSKEQISAEGAALADAVVDFGVKVFERKERERQYQEEVTYAFKRENASEAKNPDAHSWTDGEFSQVYNYGDRASDLAHMRFVALRELKQRIQHVERLVRYALEELPEARTPRDKGVTAQLTGALAILNEEYPQYIKDVRIWSNSGLCAVCNCDPCRARMEYYEKYDGFTPGQPEAPLCCLHKDASLYLPF